MSSYPGDERWAMEQARKTDQAMRDKPAPAPVEPAHYVECASHEGGRCDCQDPVSGKALRIGEPGAPVPAAPEEQHDPELGAYLVDILTGLPPTDEPTAADIEDAPAAETAAPQMPMGPRS